MPISFDEFARQLIDSGLLPADDLAAVRKQISSATAEQLARELVRQGKLTPYQAQQTYARQAKSLSLGNYIILDKLGQGGMGLVFKARHRRINRVVALKVLAPHLTKTPEIVARFHREVQAVARLEHPNIVSAYDADESNGRHYFVMQYVEGKDLGSVVSAQGPLSIRNAIDCGLQAARGLQFAHEQGVIHRDIKPANLLLDGNGTVRILDLGLARIADDAGMQAQLTNTGAVMGTVDYMPPEQALDTRSADARSDVYSLGATLWHLLTGRPLYDGSSLMARLLAHREAAVPSLIEAFKDRPTASDTNLLPALNAVFQRMVAKNPDERYPTMSEVIVALEAVPRVLTIAHPVAAVQTAPAICASRVSPSRSEFPISVEPSVSQKRSSGSWRTQGLVIGTGAIAAALLVAFYLQLPREPKGDNRPTPNTVAPAIVAANEQNRIREALKWVRNAGGSAVVERAGETISVDQRNPSPVGQLTVRKVDLSGAFGVRAADLAVLAHLPTEFMLTVPSHLSDTQAAEGLRLVPKANPVGVLNVDPVLTPRFGLTLRDHPVGYLIIGQRQLSPGSLQALATLPNLQSLLLQKCDVSPEVLAELRHLPHLKYLNLEASTITDEHLGKLAFARPVNLSLYGVGITADGIVDYLRRHPGATALDGVPADLAKTVLERLQAGAVGKSAENEPPR